MNTHRQETPAEKKTRIFRERAKKLAAENAPRDSGGESLELLEFLLGKERYAVETASIFRETFRVSDIPGRIGGDEFAVLMLHDGEDQPGNAVERLEEAIRRANGRRTREYSLSMSLGLSEWNPGRPVSLGELMADADRRMYENKMARKGNVCGE